MKGYIVDINAKPLIDGELNSFPQDVIDEIVKYREEKHFKQSFTAWSVLKWALMKDFKIDINKLKLKHNEYGKPFYDEIWFSISHSENIVAVVVSNNWCGVDTEIVNDVSLDLNKKILTPLENKVFMMLPTKIQKRNYLIRQWVIKEAYYKMTGTGISYEKLTSPIQYPADNIYFEEISDRNDNNYYVAIVGDIKNLELYKNI